jgi:hypothetical protein
MEGLHLARHHNQILARGGENRFSSCRAIGTAMRWDKRAARGLKVVFPPILLTSHHGNTPTMSKQSSFPRAHSSVGIKSAS